MTGKRFGIFGTNLLGRFAASLGWCQRTRWQEEDLPTRLSMKLPSCQLEYEVNEIAPVCP